MTRIEFPQLLDEERKEDSSSSNSDEFAQEEVMKNHEANEVLKSVESNDPTRAASFTIPLPQTSTGALLFKGLFSAIPEGSLLRSNSLIRSQIMKQSQKFFDVRVKTETSSPPNTTRTTVRQTHVPPLPYTDQNVTASFPQPLTQMPLNVGPPPSLPGLSTGIPLPPMVKGLSNTPAIKEALAIPQDYRVHKRQFEDENHTPAKRRRIMQMSSLMPGADAPPGASIGLVTSFKCDKCRPTAYFESSRKRYLHMYTVHPTRQHAVPCGKTFKQKCHAKRHQSKCKGCKRILALEPHRATSTSMGYAPGTRAYEAAQRRHIKTEQQRQVAGMAPAFSLNPSMLLQKSLHTPMWNSPPTRIHPDPTSQIDRIPSPVFAMNGSVGIGKIPGEILRRQSFSSLFNGVSMQSVSSPPLRSLSGGKLVNPALFMAAHGAHGMGTTPSIQIPNRACVPFMLDAIASQMPGRPQPLRQQLAQADLLRGLSAEQLLRGLSGGAHSIPRPPAVKQETTPSN